MSTLPLESLSLCPLQMTEQEGISWVFPSFSKIDISNHDDGKVQFLKQLSPGEPDCDLFTEDVAGGFKAFTWTKSPSIMGPGARLPLGM